MTNTKRTSEDIVSFTEKFFSSKKDWVEWYEEHVEPHESKDGFELVLTAQADYDGWPEILAEVYFDVGMTPDELKEQSRQNLIEHMAKEKGISFHEASVLQSLQERGKL